MAPSPQTPGIVSGRLSPEALAANFADIAPALSPHEALVAADRCYFCYDAPCVAACPTSIDIPLFIREIASGVPEAAARTILSQNILGGMCARVCPTETLCEEACVREAAEGRPVEIGRLQRFATDTLMREGPQPFARAAPTGKRVAVVGAGPAGPRLRPPPRHARPRRRAHGRPRQARRAQRVRHRRLQGGGRLRPGRGRLAPRHRRHHRPPRRAPRNAT